MPTVTDLLAGLSLSSAIQINLLQSAITLVVLWVLLTAARAIIRRRIADQKLGYHWRKAVTYIAVILGLLIIGRIWVPGLRDVTTFLGLLSAGLAIALKDLVANMAGWLFIIWRRPFLVGDRIQIGEHRGDVIDLRLFQFSLLEIGNWVDAEQSTGRIIHIPNGRVLNEPLANYNRAFPHIWEELPVLVTFESDWRAAKRILLEVVQRHSEHLTESAAEQIREAARQFMIVYTVLTPTVYTSVRDSGVLLTARFMCDPRQRRALSQAMWEDLLDAFAARPEIDWAYPTTRFYDNVQEGKSVPASHRPTPAP
jgi:small-conductance mechanosensitive channel